MYVRDVREETLEFRHRGWLLDESFIFYDRTYDSLWVQATGTCIKGKFQGEQLATVPVTHTTWSAWKASHPDTVVLAKPAHLIDRYARDAYARSYAARGTRFGLAVFVGDEQRLYPLDELEGSPLVHDEIAGRAVLVVYHGPSRTAVALEPLQNDASLRFEIAEVSEHDVLVRETVSGTLWSGLTGRRQSDDAAPSRLSQHRSTQFVVANWPQHFPSSPVFRAR